MAATGNKRPMESLTRLRDARRTVARTQRRIWLAQALAGPALVLFGVVALGAVTLWWRRRSVGSGRHELPDTQGAHRVDEAEGSSS
jgi:hypothetical protein